MISTGIAEFRLKPIAAACSIIAAFSAAPAAQAQTAAAAGQVAATPAESGITQVQVVGIRKGIEDAISVKKDATSIVEAISAEDIGKLPDSSIAESIARLPGLTAQRVNGRAQEISVRGMSGDFASTLMNGREQVSTGDNRSAQFDQYPSELLSGVVIYKTPDATLIGQGLAGTIDLQTVRPLAFSGRQVALNVRGQKEGVGSEAGSGRGKRLSAFYIDQFADRTFGVALGFARFQSQGNATIRNGDYSDVVVGGQTVSAPTHFKDFTNHKDEKRDGLMGVLQWKPNKDFASMVDLYYSKFDSPTTRKGYETVANASWSGGCASGCTLTDPVIKDGKVDSGVWNGTHAVIANDIDQSQAKLKAAGWNNRLRLDANWTVEGDLSYSEAKRHESPYETWAGAPKNMGDSIAFSNGAAGLAGLQWKPSLNYTDPKIITLMDAGGWGMAGYLKNLQVEDRLKSVRLSAERSLPDNWPVSRLTAGVNYSNRYKSRSVPEYQLQLKAGDNGAITGAGSALAGDSGIPMISYNELGLAGRYNFVTNNYFDIYLKAWEVTEKNFTGYTKLDIDTEVASIPVRGNVGVQVVHIDQSSTGNAIDTGSGSGDSNRPVSRLTDGARYTDVLPSLNLAASFAHEQTVRLGLAKVMARPRMDQMSNSGTYYVDGLDLHGPLWKGSGGNPRLEPFRAKAIDLSYEKYFDKKAYVAAAAFYKKLDSYIYTYTNGMYDFTGHQNLSPFTPKSNIGEFTQPQNGTGGNIHGVELSASLPFSLLLQPLDGFGVQASYAHTDSAIKPFGNNDNSPLPGLSRQTSNLTLYYEKHGFSARVAQRQRSNFLGEIIGYASNRRFQYIKAEKVVDLQIGYDFEAGWLKGTSLLLQVNNLTNAKYQEYQDRPDNITSSTKYGKTVLFGVNYKL
ncbi:TonB-dependent receptor [Massilia terrae]|uniref:TonB-dependent receptor n=1 Tax=Massilia terrae TaxID=1811224 RepID=A0ABT2D4M8_9BURK|nr:TonB-dependent receptor [Massilia terrae]MCS0661188.1 TonB-dependent receptor [Massilia terrae]